MDFASAQVIGAGLAAIGVGAAAIGVGNVFGSFLETQPPVNRTNTLTRVEALTGPASDSDAGVPGIALFRRR